MLYGGMMLKLSGRLAAIYELIPVKKRIADIGTDHGYIPVRLALDGAEDVIASDIREGPLLCAKKTAVRYHVEEKIRFVLAPGLAGVGSDDADCIVIAGMGGEVIGDILLTAPWLRDPGKTVILQPQSKKAELMACLISCGFRLTGGAVVEDGGRFYEILRLSGVEGEPLVDEYSFYRYLRDREDKLPDSYLSALIEKEKRALDGLTAAKQGHEREIAERSQRISDLLRLRRDGA